MSIVVGFDGFIAVRILSQFLRATAWFAGTVALFGLAILFRYATYRVLWGGDNPRRH